MASHKQSLNHCPSSQSIHVVNDFALLVFFCFLFVVWLDNIII